LRAIEALAAEADGDVPFSKQVDATRDFTLHEHGHTLRNLVSVLPPRVREQAERAIRPGTGPMRKWVCWHGDTPFRRGFGRPPAELLVRKQDDAA
jgi:hypothetical protein